MYQRILVPLDGSDAAERGLREAVDLAAEQKAALFLLHIVVDDPLLEEISSSGTVDTLRRSLRRYGEELLRKADEKAAEAGVQTARLLVEVARRRCADVIVDEARKAGCDLIVMGTHGRRGISRLMLGSDAELVARVAPVPVLLVRLAEPSSEPPG